MNNYMLTTAINNLKQTMDILYAQSLDKALASMIARRLIKLHEWYIKNNENAIFNLDFELNVSFMTDEKTANWLTLNGLNITRLTKKGNYYEMEK